MDPKTGHILAQASAPTFDPNNAQTITQSKLRNPAVQEVYEPGSTGKVITVAAALEEKIVTPGTVFTIPYSLKVAGESMFMQMAEAILFRVQSKLESMQNLEPA